MKNFRMAFFVLATIVMFALLLNGCGSTTKAAWQNDQVDSTFKKGMSTTDLIQLLGQPTQKSTRNSVQVWVYKKAAENSSLNKKLAWFDIFGVASGENSLQTDVLRFYIKDNTVLEYTLQTNAGSDILGGNREEPSLPKNMSEEKKQPIVKEKKVAAEEQPTPKPVSKTVSSSEPIFLNINGLDYQCTRTDQQPLSTTPPDKKKSASPDKKKTTAKVKKSTRTAAANP